MPNNHDEENGAYERIERYTPQERMVRLEANIATSTRKIEELEESHEGLKRGVNADRIALATTLGEIKGGIRMLLICGSIFGSLIVIVISAAALVLKR